MSIARKTCSRFPVSGDLVQTRGNSHPTGILLFLQHFLSRVGRAKCSVSLYPMLPSISDFLWLRISLPDWSEENLIGFSKWGRLITLAIPECTHFKKVWWVVRGKSQALTRTRGYEGNYDNYSLFRLLKCNSTAQSSTCCVTCYAKFKLMYTVLR